MTDREDGKPLSKSAIKKLVKEQDKANKEKEKAAKRAALEEEQRKAAANDHSTHLYGKFPIIKSQPATNHEPEVDLEDLKLGDSTVTIRARAYNLRAQSAKLAFLMLRQEQSSVQAVVAASDLISKHMVKWIGSLNAESIVLVSGLVKEPVTPIKSATLSHLEIQIQKVFLVSEAQAPLTIQPEDCRRPEGTDQPTVSQATKLNNRALDLRTAENNSILNISSGVCEFYQTHLRQLKFKEVHTPKLNNAASEGGSNVFEVKYFDQKAYLAQSPQLYKQMLIAGDQRRIFEIADVFRAEDSNTNRHLTEVRSSQRSWTRLIIAVHKHGF
jgi:aspartyl/asparaginyl-tRNA synthetase